MTLAEILQPKLADWRPTGHGRQCWSESFAEAGWTVTLTTDQTDTLSCLVWELSLTRIDPSPCPGQNVRSWAERMAAQVSGLMEPLTLIEADTTQDRAILRSVTPAHKGDHLFYYEVSLTGTTQATLRRYRIHTDGNSRREPIAFALTHEALAQVADGMTR
ncbi:MAG: hypothetical protein LC104_20620 [Bacteroidales bacterium]|nr:hypothetical protein [Bacteroidales bacterium]